MQSNPSKKKKRKSDDSMRQSSSISESDGSYCLTKSDSTEIDNCPKVQGTMLCQSSAYSEGEVILHSPGGCPASD